MAEPAGAQSSLLSVHNSLMLARWIVAPQEQDIVERIMRDYGLPEIVARLLQGRGVAPDAIEQFLYPKLGRDFPDPFALAGMGAMADAIADAVINRVPLGIFGDFDVDGATSTAILVRFFRHCGLEVPFYIPDRMKEGYGPSVQAFDSLKSCGVKTVILCDCGITAHEVIAKGREMGLDIVILDHHEAEEKLPPANYVIDPKRKDDTSGYTMLAACGVSFLACVAINARLRERSWYEKQGIAEAPLKDLLDLVALGTVCDMVPLTGPNRLFVRFGFAQAVQTKNAGLRALMEVAGVKGAMTPYHAGFILGPRINAGSRVHKADLGATLLSTDDPEEARNIAWTLNDCNDKRKEIQAQMMDHAIALVEKGNLHNAPVIVVGHEEWHPGLSGLVAGRLKEKYGKPAVVITYAPGDETGGMMEGRGSGRSVPGANMGAAFIAARNEGLLLKGGGHAMAAGFTVLPERVDDFTAFLYDNISGQLEGQPQVSDTVIDAVLSVRGAKPDFVRIIGEHVGPFGQGHEEPLFALPQVRLHKAKIVGDGHVSCQISDWEGGAWMKAVAFRAADTPLGQAILQQGRDTPFHVAGHLKINEWQGREYVEMHIQDAALAVEQAALAGRKTA